MIKLPDYLQKYEYFMYWNEENLMSVIHNHLHYLNNDGGVHLLPKATLNEKAAIYLEIAACCISLLNSLKELQNPNYVEITIPFAEMAACFLSLARRIEYHYPHYKAD